MAARDGPHGPADIVMDVVGQVGEGDAERPVAIASVSPTDNKAITTTTVPMATAQLCNAAKTKLTEAYNARAMRGPRRLSIFTRAARPDGLGPARTGW